MSAPAADFSAAEFVKTLSDEQKGEVFFALLEEELAQCREPVAVPLARENAPPMAYLLSAKEYNALQQKYQFPHADDAEYEAKRVARTERDWLTTEEVVQLLDEEDMEPDQESPLPSIAGRTPGDR